MSYYVYALIDPRTNSPFYIGKGQRNRINQHELEAATGKPSRKCSTIREIISSGLTIEKQIVRRFSCEKAAYEFEEAEIARIGLHNLTNVMCGGSGGKSSERAKSRGVHFDTSVVKLFFRLKAIPENYVLDVFGHLVDIPISHRKRVDGWMREILAKRGKDWVLKVAKPATA